MDVSDLTEMSILREVKKYTQPTMRWFFYVFQVFREKLEVHLTSKYETTVASPAACQSK